MTGRERENAFYKGGGFSDGTEQEIAFERIRRQARRDTSRGDQCPYFRSEKKRPIRAGVVQGFNAQPIPSKENPGAPGLVTRCAGGTCVPDGEGEHSAQFAH